MRRVVVAIPRFAIVHMLDIPTLLSSDDHKLMCYPQIVCSNSTVLSLYHLWIILLVLDTLDSAPLNAPGGLIDTLLLIVSSRRGDEKGEVKFFFGFGYCTLEKDIIRISIDCAIIERSQYILYSLFNIILCREMHCMVYTAIAIVMENKERIPIELIFGSFEIDH